MWSVFSVESSEGTEKQKGFHCPRGDDPSNQEVFHLYRPPDPEQEGFSHARRGHPQQEVLLNTRGPQNQEVFHLHRPSDPEQEGLRYPRTPFWKEETLCDTGRGEVISGLGKDPLEVFHLANFIDSTSLIQALILFLKEQKVPFKHTSVHSFMSPSSPSPSQAEDQTDAPRPPTMQTLSEEDEILIGEGPTLDRPMTSLEKLQIIVGYAIVRRDLR